MATPDSTNTLPIIDFTNPGLRPGNPEWESVKSQVKFALEEYGCFQAMFKRAEDKEMILNFNILDDLFELPLDTKLHKESDKPLHTYFRQLPHGPLFEGFSINDPTTLEKIESFAKLMWPQGNPDFSKNLNSFAERVLIFHGTLREMILESLGVVKYLDELENLTNYIIGIQKYEEPGSGDAKVGLNTHKDSNIMTILYQNQVGGLEIQTKNGDWILASPPPNSFIVIVGESLDALRSAPNLVLRSSLGSDTKKRWNIISPPPLKPFSEKDKIQNGLYLEAWTNGRFHVPLHRVMMSGNERRYTLGLFTFLKAGFIVKAPEELVDELHPLIYKPFDYSEFRKYRNQYSDTSDLLDLKSYCGV